LQTLFTGRELLQIELEEFKKWLAKKGKSIQVVKANLVPAD
jgi:DNA replication protein DnaD